MLCSIFSLCVSLCVLKVTIRVFTTCFCIGESEKWVWKYIFSQNHNKKTKKTEKQSCPPFYARDLILPFETSMITHPQYPANFDFRLHDAPLSYHTLWECRLYNMSCSSSQHMLLQTKHTHDKMFTHVVKKMSSSTRKNARARGLPGKKWHIHVEKSNIVANWVKLCL